MKFELECGCMDGLVLIDQDYLHELDYDMLCAMEILLDISGKSELICDFPDEAWPEVRERETKSIREFCNSGKMIIWLMNGVKKECEIVYDDNVPTKNCAVPYSKWLHLPTGKLLAVSASEFLQCLFYPELEMEKFFEMTVAEGWYAITDENMDKIKYCRRQHPNTVFENIQEIT